MKPLIYECLGFLRALLPFLRKKEVGKLREFSDLIVSQYEFLAGQLELFQQDYYELSGRVREMHKEVIVLSEQLRDALALECRVKDCRGRNFSLADEKSV